MPEDEADVAVDGAVLAVITLRPADPAVNLLIRGRSVLDQTIAALRAASWIGPIVLALEEISQAEAVAAIFDPGALRVQAAGPSADRWRAISDALALAPPTEHVLVHDADRPLVSRAVLARLLAIARNAPVVATGTPVRSSIKRVAEGRIVATVPRDGLHVIHGPWLFRRAVLQQALDAVPPTERAAEDEIALLGRGGVAIRLVTGDPLNVPVRSPADARFAELAVARGLLAT